MPVYARVALQRVPSCSRASPREGWRVRVPVAMLLEKYTGATGGPILVTDGIGRTYFVVTPGAVI